MAGGRPKKEFKQEYCDDLIAHMELGLSFESFGAEIPCCKQTLYTWTETYPEFLDAKNIGTSLSLKYWETQGLNGMWGGKKFNPAVWIFNMRNRFGWRDEKKEEDTNANKLPSIKLNYAKSPTK